MSVLSICVISAFLVPCQHQKSFGSSPRPSLINSIIYGVTLGPKVYYQCNTLIILRVTLIVLRATLIILRATLNNVTRKIINVTRKIINLSHSL